MIDMTHTECKERGYIFRDLHRAHRPEGANILVCIRGSLHYQLCAIGWTNKAVKRTTSDILIDFSR